MIVRDHDGDLHVIGPGEALVVVEHGREHALMRLVPGHQNVLLCCGSLERCRTAQISIWEALQKRVPQVDLFDEKALGPPELKIVPINKGRK